MWKHIINANIQICKAIKKGLFLVLILGCATTTYKVTDHDSNGSIKKTYYTKEKMTGTIHEGDISFKDIHGELIRLSGIITIGIVE